MLIFVGTQSEIDKQYFESFWYLFTETATCQRHWCLFAVQAELSPLTGRSIFS